MRKDLGARRDTNSAQASRPWDLHVVRNLEQEGLSVIRDEKDESSFARRTAEGGCPHIRT
jgi:hypothetical protein